MVYAVDALVVVCEDVRPCSMPQFACRLTFLTSLHVTSHVGLRRWNAVGTSLHDQRMQHYGDAALLSPIVTVFHQISSSRLRSPKCCLFGTLGGKSWPDTPEAPTPLAMLPGLY
jgi:hypothetical protein